MGVFEEGDDAIQPFALDPTFDYDHVTLSPNPLKQVRAQNNMNMHHHARPLLRAPYTMPSLSVPSPWGGGRFTQPDTRGVEARPSTVVGVGGSRLPTGSRAACRFMSVLLLVMSVIVLLSNSHERNTPSRTLR